jgi:hypothetical protein
VADELRLNSLARFRKQSPHLILEEHGHCEVPAGCGGVVLRWRNPLSPIPVQLIVFPGLSTVYLDGTHPQSSRPLLAPGPHVLSIVLNDAYCHRGLLMFVASFAPKGYGPDSERAGLTGSFCLVSAEDATWKYTLTPPEGDGWRTAEFDDRAWTPMVAVSRLPPNQGDSGAYQFRACQEQGATCLGLAEADRNARMATVWVRKILEIPRPAPE